MAMYSSGSIFKATVLISYLLILLWLVLFKCSFDVVSVFDNQLRDFNLNPFADVSSGNLRQMVDNLVVFIPLGLLLGVNFKQSTTWYKLAFVFLFSLAAEAFQFIFAIGTTDIMDVIMNTAGGFLGIRLYDVSPINRKKQDWIVTLGAMALLVAFVSLRIFILRVNY